MVWTLSPLKFKFLTSQGIYGMKGGMGGSSNLVGGLAMQFLMDGQHLESESVGRVNCKRYIGV